MSAPRSQRTSTFSANRSDQPKSTILTWLWLLVIAPGRVVTLHSPYPPEEVVRRLRSSKAARILKPSQAMIRLPTERNQRRLFIWIEPETQTSTRISGQTQTPYRIALMRLLISAVMFFLAFTFLPTGRIWLGMMFIAGGIGFLTLAQYERLVGRDLRLHLDWLRRVLDAR